MIIRISKISIWFDWVALFPLRAYPTFSFFNGGCYWKLGIYWFKYLLEFSGPKKDKTKYKKVTSEELNEILKDLK